jgi:hypothetical protein
VQRARQTCADRCQASWRSSSLLLVAAELQHFAQSERTLSPAPALRATSDALALGSCGLIASAMPSPREQTLIWPGLSDRTSFSKDYAKDERTKDTSIAGRPHIASRLATEIKRRQLSADKLQRRPRACEMSNRADGAAGTRRRWLADRPVGSGCAKGCIACGWLTGVLVVCAEIGEGESGTLLWCCCVYIDL